MSKFNLKSIKEEFKSKGIFYTQPELAEFMKSLVDIEITDVYDPTCGDGSLLSVFDDNVKKFGQEINDHQLVVANERLKNFNGFCGDTLSNPAFMDKKFSCIVANPPFSINWNPPKGLFMDERFTKCSFIPPKSKADYAFMLHIIHLLSDNGIAVVLNFPGVLYRGNSEGKIRQWMVENNLIEKVIYIAGDKFVDTKIATCCIVFKKNKKTTNIEFIDSEKQLNKIVSFEEIKQNDFTLSVSSYVQEEKEVIILDPKELQYNARKSMLKKLKADIEIDKMVCELEGYEFNDYLSDLEDLVCSYQINTQVV